MWKKLDLKQFLEEHGYDLTSSKTQRKTVSSLKTSIKSSEHIFKPNNSYIKPKSDSQSDSKSALSKLSKKCNYCEVYVSIKKYEKHVNEKCPKHPNNLKETRKVDGFLKYYRMSKDVQISELAKQFNKHPSIIITLFKRVGLDVSSENDYVDKIFAESLNLVFKTKNDTVATSKIKPSKPEKLVLPTKPKQTPPIIRTFPYVAERTSCLLCKAVVKSENFEIHIKNQCPQRKENINNSSKTLKVKKLSWQLLPQGDWRFQELLNHFKRLGLTKKWKGKTFDEQRLYKIEKSLSPVECYIGKEEFDGYVVYCFDWTKNVVLECPIYGNAIYVIKEGKVSWQAIAKVSKKEARTKYFNQVKAINHSETWLARLEASLRYGF